VKVVVAFILLICGSFALWHHDQRHKPVPSVLHPTKKVVFDFVHHPPVDNIPERAGNLDLEFEAPKEQ
jgi:hypothetical protein